MKHHSERALDTQQRERCPMHDQLEHAARELGIHGQLVHMREAADFSQQQIQFARGWLRGRPNAPTSKSDIVAFGSLARNEFTTESDFDYLVLAHELDTNPRGPRDLLDIADELRREFRFSQPEGADKEIRGPGATKLFGVTLSAVDLSEHIGLDDDSNHNLTRRLMLLEESVSLLNPTKHDALLTSILDRYLIGYEDGTKPGVPRFLLNDVIRYWRTIAVDYQAKVWGGATDGWGLRYLKLIVSRKLTYASTLVSLMLCSETNPARSEWLLGQFAMPPLARLAQLYEHLRAAGDDVTPLATVFRVAEEFIAKSSENDWRLAVKAVPSLSKATSVHEFVEMRDRARELQDALQAIFFRTKLFGETSERYLAF